MTSSAARVMSPSFREFASADEALAEYRGHAEMPSGVIGLPQLCGLPLYVLGGKGARKRQPIIYNMPNTPDGRIRRFEFHRGEGPFPTQRHSHILQALIMCFAYHWTKSGELHVNLADIGEFLGQARCNFNSKSIKEAIKRYSTCTVHFINGYSIGSGAEQEWVSWQGSLLVGHTTRKSKKRDEGHKITFHPEIVRLIKSLGESGRARLFNKDAFSLLDDALLSIYAYVWSFGTSSKDGRRREIERHEHTLKAAFNWREGGMSWEAWIVPRLDRLKELGLIADWRREGHRYFITLANINILGPKLKLMSEIKQEIHARKYAESFYKRRKKAGYSKAKGGLNRLPQETQEQVIDLLERQERVRNITLVTKTSKSHVYETRRKMRLKMKMRVEDFVGGFAKEKPAEKPFAPIHVETVKNPEVKFSEHLNPRGKLLMLFKERRHVIPLQDQAHFVTFLRIKDLPASTCQQLEKRILAYKRE